MSINKEKTIHEIYEDRFKGCCYHRVHYFINPEKKTIACKIEPYACHSYFDDQNLSASISINRSFFEYCCDMDITFTAKTVCDKEDTFRIDFGKKLAYDKAMFKLLDRKKRFFETMVKTFEEDIKNVTQEISNVDESIEQVSKRYQKKLEEV